MLFQYYGLRKTWLDKCLRSPVAEEPSTNDMVNGLKHSLNPHSSTFMIFVDHCGCN